MNGLALLVDKPINETSLRRRIYFGRALPNWGVTVRHQGSCLGAATLVTQESHPFRGESMSIYTQESILDDNDPLERTLEIVFAKLCSKTVIYADLGISNGMMLGIEDAIKNKRNIEVRYLKNFKSMF